jgi:hypothetical protein
MKIKIDYSTVTYQQLPPQQERSQAKMATDMMTDLSTVISQQEKYSMEIIAPSYIMIEQHIKKVEEELKDEEEKLSHLQHNLYDNHGILKFSSLTKSAYYRYENNMKKIINHLNKYIYNSPIHVCKSCKKQKGWCSTMCSNSALYWVNTFMVE